MKEFEELTPYEVEKLRVSGLLYTIYPEVECKETRPKPKSINEIDIHSFIEFTESVLDDFENYGYSKDCNHYSFETLIEAIYGKDAWVWINKNNVGD